MVCLKAELQLPPNISELQGVNGHAARGHRKQTSGETPGRTFSKSRERGGVRVRGPLDLVGPK